MLKLRIAKLSNGVFIIQKFNFFFGYTRTKKLPRKYGLPVCFDNFHSARRAVNYIREKEGKRRPHVVETFTV